MEPPASIIYSSVILHDSVFIAFLLAALNDLDIFAANLQNEYFNADCCEKMFLEGGAEFGSD